MAYVKTIPIHSIQGITNCLMYIEDKSKTVIIDNDDGTQTTLNLTKDVSKTVVVQRDDGSSYRVVTDMNNKPVGDIGEIPKDVLDALAYATNVEKTTFELDGDKDILVSGYNCAVETASADFALLKYNYEERLRRQGIDPASRIVGTKTTKDGKTVDKEAREAYHMVMSFSERADLTPHLVHKIGLEFCERVLNDTCAVVSTHMNTKHLHNHIVFSAYNKNKLGKYRDTMKQIEYIRAISDELSLKYGLDIIINEGREDRGVRSYSEKLAKEQGISWKELLKGDIKKTINISSSWQEFKENMLSLGYGVVEKPNSVTYYFLNDDNKKVRDNKLGTDYSRLFIKEVYGEVTEEEAELVRKKKLKESEIKPTEPVRVEETTPELEESEKEEKKSTNKVNDVVDKISAYKKKKEEKKYNNRLSIYVARYTPTGRRRSDLELLFLGAIKLIKHFGNKNYDKEQAKLFNNNPVYQPANMKLRNMQASLNATIGLGIRDLQHLRELKNKAGAEKSHLEADIVSVQTNLKLVSELNRKADTLLELQKLIKARGLDKYDMMPMVFSEEDVRKNRAKHQPMTAKQRRSLYNALNESGFRVVGKWDSLTYNEANEILAFMKNKDLPMPKTLATDEEADHKQRVSYYEKICVKRDNDSKGRLEGKAVSSGQKRIIDNIRKDHPELTIEPKNMFEANQIISYYRPNLPIKGNVASDTDVKKIKLLLDEKGLTIGRQHITEEELAQIQKYLDGKVKTMPNVLKESKPIEERHLLQIEELLKIKEVTLPIPAKDLTESDYFAVFDYLLHKGYTPPILRPILGENGGSEIDYEAANKTLNHSFEKSIEKLSSEEQGYLYQYRTLMNEFLSMGFKIEDLSSIKVEAANLSKEYNAMKERISELNYEYRNLSRLEYNSNLAKNEAYTKGVLYKDDDSPDKYDKMLKAMDERMKRVMDGKEITKQQEKTLYHIREENPSLNINPKDRYEAYLIICYFRDETPLLGKLCNESKVEELNEALDKIGLPPLHRSDITEIEYAQVKDYIAKCEKYEVENVHSKPTILKEVQGIKDYQVKHLEDLMKMKKVDCPIKLSTLSVNEYRELLDFLLHKDSIPDILNDTIEQAKANKEKSKGRKPDKTSDDKYYDDLATRDSDGDGISDLEELAFGTDMYSRGDDEDVIIDESTDSDLSEEDEELEEEALRDRRDNHIESLLDVFDPYGDF